MCIEFYTKDIRPAASGRVKPGPSACQLDALTTTLPAPLVMKFQMYEHLSLVCILLRCLLNRVGNGTEFIFLRAVRVHCIWRIQLFDEMSQTAFHLCLGK